MRAAVYYENGGPEVLKYEEVPDPVCADDGVLVEITTFGSEVFPRFGMPPVLPVSEPSADA